MNNIDIFLKNLFTDYQAGFEINTKIVYKLLTIYNVPENERLIDNSDLFQNWINYYQNNNNSNLDVFVSPNWQYFCQFVSKQGQINDECYKIYIPLNRSHLEYGVKQIFDFINDNNIVHLSKVAKQIRFDDVVIRVNKAEDVIKIKNFIKNNSYIQEGLIKGNPFAYSENGINFGFDGALSYNNCISALITTYIKTNKNNHINNINADSFKKFIEDAINNSDKLNYFADFIHDPHNSINSKTYIFYIYDLLNAYLSNSNFNEYIKRVECYKNVNLQNSVFKYMNPDLILYNHSKELFDEFILETMKKYPIGYDPNNKNISGYDYINKFLNTNNYRAVTRNNGLRMRMQENLNNQDCIKIILNSNVPGNNVEEIKINYIQITMLNAIIQACMIKYPTNYLLSLNRFLTTGNPNFISAKINKARYLAFTLNNQQINQLFQRLNVHSFEEYIDMYYNCNEKKFAV